MANYYCQASVMIHYDTEEECSWLIQALTRARDGYCETCTHCHTAECPCGCYENDCDPAGFTFQKDQDEVGERDDNDTYVTRHVPAIWVSSDEYMDIDSLVNIVQRYQIIFNRQEHWIIEASYSCSKPRLDGFSGMGCLVSLGEAYWFYPCNEIDRLSKELALLRDFAATLPQD